MNKAKFKGWKLEHYLENYFRSCGIPCRRRGMAGAEDLYFDDWQMTAECKAWKKGIKTLYNLKGEKEILFIKWVSREVRGKEILVVMGLKDFVGLVKKIK